MGDAQFDEERARSVEALRKRDDLRSLARTFLIATSELRYSYNFDWLGLPVIQFPPDIVAVQELLWRIKPELVVETGVARGGSLALSASVLELIGGVGRVLGIDVDIREPNRRAIEAHPLSHRIELMEGSSIEERIVARVRERARGKSPVMVLLDSMHTHDHVLAELNLYSPLVSDGSYLIVFDTVIEDMPADSFLDRPWGPGDNPRTAVDAFLATNPRFEVDHDLEAKLLVTVAPGGYLKCIG